jgi:hypothetical protein
MRFLADSLSKESDEKATGVHFLMPCHSAPLYSHLHVDVPTWVLDCAPETLQVADFADTSALSASVLKKGVLQSRDYTVNAAFDADPLAFVQTAYEQGMLFVPLAPTLLLLHAAI